MTEITKQIKPIVPMNNLTDDQMNDAFDIIRIPGIKEKFWELQANPSSLKMTHKEFMAALLFHEITSRDTRRIERLLKDSGLRKLPCFSTATIENLKDKPGRSLNIAELRALASCEWITMDMPPAALFTGASGTGKTWILAMLGRAACMRGIPVMYIRFPDLVERFRDRLLHNGQEAMIRSLSTKKLLIIDDFGICPIDPETASAFGQLIDTRHQTYATIIGGQLSPAEWHTYLGGDSNADAIMDRLLNYSYKTQLQGPSMREQQPFTLSL